MAILPQNYAFIQIKSSALMLQKNIVYDKIRKEFCIQCYFKYITWELIYIKEGVVFMSCNCNCVESSRAALEKAGIDTSLLVPTFEKYGKVQGGLISILQQAQDIYGYLPVELLNYIALSTGNKPAKVLGVATFYAQFRLEPVGKYLIMLCQGTACHVNGSSAIEDAICEEIGVTEGETTEDGLFTLNNVACLGCCSLSPVMMINGETYGTLTPAKAKEIIASIRAKEVSEA